jgi:predicted NBD/HSP70 family sugar kinase
MKILVIDVGGTHIKLGLSKSRRRTKLPSGRELTPEQLVQSVSEAVARWRFDAISIGYPGPVRDGKPAQEPRNLGPGWVRFDFARAFGKPVRVINDAAMQALGSYRGGRMLFLGLGTGLGTALVTKGQVEPLELGHLPYRHGKSYEDYLGKRGLQRLGKKRWRAHVECVVRMLQAALLADYVSLGGGNVKKLGRAPRGTRVTSNAHAIIGGIRLWDTADRRREVRLSGK